MNDALESNIVITLTNSISKTRERFVPIDAQHVTMYACGPTVYDRAHLGNARAAVVYDVLFRLLQQHYPKVTYVRNITDVDDKIIAACLAEGINAVELTEVMTEHYRQDMAALNCLPPTYEPKATEHIGAMIAMIERLIDTGHAYIASEHVLFAVDSFSEYGALSNRSQEEMIAGSRVEVAPYKRNPGDFVLWKPSPAGEEVFGFDSPWGRGRPGWHIECSAMTKALLGEHFDIHGGGADLMFPHHENEIAQSKCASEHGQFANYWVHNGFLMVDGQKMSKSLGNFKTVADLLEKNIDGSIIRYFYLTAHYRKPLDLTDKALDDAKKAMQKFSAVTDGVSVSDCPPEILAEFLDILSDDLNTPMFLARMHHYAGLWLSDPNNRIAQLTVASALQLIGLKPLALSNLAAPQEILELADLRKAAKEHKNWAEADSLRDKIRALGFEVLDEKEGFILKRL